MRTYLVPVLALSLLATDAFAQRRGGGDRQRESTPVELKNFTYERVEFESPSTEREKSEFGIYLPKDYADEANADKTYPWVIWLHGFRGDLGKFHDRGGARVLDELRGEDKIPELILVALSSGRQTAYVNGESTGDMEDQVTKDLVDYVTANYRASKERRHRAIMGVSMGGMGALKIALKHPQAFGTVAAHSSAIMPANPEDAPEQQARYIMGSIRRLGLSEVFGDPIDMKKWRAEMPMALVEDKSKEELTGLRIYFDAGTDDRYRFGPPNVQLHEAMEKHGIAHTFNYVEGGGHSWGSGAVQKALVDSLQFVGAGFTAEERKTETGTEKSAEPASTGKGK